MSKRDKIFAVVMAALEVDDPELVDQPTDTGFQKGTVYAEGGYDFRELWYHRETGQEVEVFWSHVNQEAKAIK